MKTTRKKTSAKKKAAKKAPAPRKNPTKSLKSLSDDLKTVGKIVLRVKERCRAPATMQEAKLVGLNYDAITTAVAKALKKRDDAIMAELAKIEAMRQRIEEIVAVVERSEVLLTKMYFQSDPELVVRAGELGSPEKPANVERESDGAHPFCDQSTVRLQTRRSIAKQHLEDIEKELVRRGESLELFDGDKDRLAAFRDLRKGIVHGEAPGESVGVEIAKHAPKLLEDIANVSNAFVESEKNAVNTIATTAASRSRRAVVVEVDA